MNISNKKINMRKNKGCYRHPLFILVEITLWQLILLILENIF